MLDDRHIRHTIVAFVTLLRPAPAHKVAGGPVAAAAPVPIVLTVAKAAIVELVGCYTGNADPRRYGTLLGPVVVARVLGPADLPTPVVLHVHVARIAIVHLSHSRIGELRPPIDIGITAIGIIAKVILVIQFDVGEGRGRQCCARRTVLRHALQQARWQRAPIAGLLCVAQPVLTH